MDWLIGKKDETQKWITQLSAPAKRAAAASELLRLGPAAVDGLVDALADKDANLRNAAAQLLVKMGTTSIPRLSQLLASVHPETRQRVADILGEIRHPSALPALTEAARGEFFTVRARAATALAKIGDPQSLPLLIELLKDKENIVRQAAAFAVIKYKDPRWLIPLSDVLLEDQQIEVRQTVASAMAESKNREVIPYLIEAMQDSFWWYERENAISPLLEAIASFGADAVQPLIETLRSAEATVRRNAAFILGLLRDPRAIEPLGMALYDFHVDVGEEAGKALGLFGAASLEVLEEATHASETSIRMHALTALELVKDPRAITLIANELSDPDREVKKRAIRALKASRDPLAQNILQPIAADRNDRELSMLAREALETLAKTIRQ